jgi:hypothetical protein
MQTQHVSATPTWTRAKVQALLDQGFWIFPCLENSKEPAVKGWQAWATRDIEKIMAYLDRHPRANLAASTSKLGDDGKALIVIDVDDKNGKRGSDEIVRLELKHDYDFPSTYTQTTPSGGRHYFYEADEPVNQGRAGVLAPGLDVRSRGGLIVLTSSVIEGRAYADNGAQIVPAPRWMPDRLGRAPARSRIVHFPSKATASDVKEATRYLIEEAPLAVEGSGGDDQTIVVANRVGDKGVCGDEALALMLEHWNPRCSPPWTEDDLRKKVFSALKSRISPVGCSVPANDFEPIPASEIADGAPAQGQHPCEKLNEEFALIFGDGGHSVMQETVDEKGAPRRIFLPEASFRRKLSTKTMTIGKKPTNLADVWLDWKGRREYPGLCFAPERQPRNGYFNLWRGFTVPPIPYADASQEAREGFDLFMDHLRANVCVGEPELAAWLLGYFAHMIQRPWERPLTTLVFRGGKGVGKNALIERVGRLLGPHFLVAHDTRYLTGNFNSHMDSCLCLVLDEAFWSGDKAADGKLKGLTTAPQILIERKGKEAYMVDNLVRLVIMGNADHLVPASEDERRYAVFDVGDGRKQDLDYFDRMRRYMDDEGGASVLLDHLKRFDLASVNVNRAPDTAALLDQKTSNLAPFGQFWLDCLSEGAILHLGQGMAGWPDRVERGALRAAFNRYSQERRITARGASAVAIGKDLEKYLAPHGAGKGAWTREGRFYELPALGEARKAWDRFIGRPCTWDAG